MAGVDFPMSLWVVLIAFHSFSTPTNGHFEYNNDSSKYEEPISRSYFGDFMRLSKYYTRVKEMEGESIRATKAYGHMDIDVVHTYSQEHWQQFLQVLSAFNDGLLRASDFKTSELLPLLSSIDEVDDGELSSSTSTCNNDTSLLVVELISGKSWALQFLDASGKPSPSITKGWVNFVGNYDQCREAKSIKTEGNNQFSGGYFTVPIFVVDGLPIPIKIGICLPSTCSAKQVTALFESVLAAAKLSRANVGKVTDHKVTRNVTAATIIAIIILLVSGTLALIGTVYDVLYVSKVAILTSNPEKAVCKISHTDEETNAIGSTKEKSYVIKETQPLIPKTKATHRSDNIAGRLLLAFSLYSNGKKLLNTSQSEGVLRSIHGIRFISITWVVLGHCYMFGVVTSSINYTTQLPLMFHQWTFDVVVNASVSVDTFFTLSGLLTSYLALPVLWRRGLKINWAKFYFHRFWRLTPPYMFVLVIVLGLQQYLGSGPLWSSEQPNDRKFCEKNWWTNLLYINNLVNPTEMCFGHSWYLANDMQFFVISPIMLISLYFHKTVGFAICTTLLAISWIVTGVLSHQYDWGTSILNIVFQDNHWVDKYYVAPWCRVGPYIVGVLGGYILAQTQGRIVKMKSWIVAVGWLTATASGLAVVYGIYGDVSGDCPSTRSVAALYNSVSRSVWGACVCWVIIACEKGYGGPINHLLSWSPFVFLGRLAHFTYLIHLPIVYVFFQNMRSLFFLNNVIMPVIFLGLLVFSVMVSFVGVLLFESPMIRMEKVLLQNEKRY